MVTYTRTLLAPQYSIEPTLPKKAVFVRIEAKAPVKPHNGAGRNIHKDKRKRINKTKQSYDTNHRKRLIAKSLQKGKRAKV